MTEKKAGPSRRSKSSERKRQPPNRQLTHLKRILRRHLPELREKYYVKSLGVFGSYVWRG